MNTLSQSLAQYIAKLGLASGDRLPSERELARSLGVSRNSLREVMKQLQAQGLVDIRHGAGTFLVASPAAFSQALHRHLASQRGRIDALFELRLAIEPGIAALAARKATDRHIQALEEAIAAQAAEEDPRRWGMRDQTVHLALAKATSNPLVEKLFGLLGTSLAETREEGLQSHERLTASVAGHRQILHAVAAHDPAAAALAMEAHILWAHTLTQFPSTEELSCTKSELPPKN